jgi:peroxiredoxin Q/BCP
MTDILPATGKVAVGSLAPDFTLPAHTGAQTRLHDLLGERALVLFFYPKDNTSGCTAEVCAFRDSYEVFKQAGAEVLGISSDSVDTHAGFAGKHQLPFILLSDKGGVVRKRYGVPSTLGLLPGRTTYIIDQKGVVRYIFSSQLSINKHIQEALRVIKSLRVQNPEPSRAEKSAEPVAFVAAGTGRTI